MHGPKPKPSRKVLNARARGQALIDLSREYPEAFARYYAARKRELYTRFKIPLTRQRPQTIGNDNADE